MHLSFQKKVRELTVAQAIDIRPTIIRQSKKFEIFIQKLFALEFPCFDLLKVKNKIPNFR
jgi:hypothetical protein